jgi:transcriptional repressor NF-X1
VQLFKTPKFVASPMKTLAQAARVRRQQLNIAAPITSTPLSDRKADEVRHDHNGLLLMQPRFALTEDELRPLVKKAAPSMEFDIVFLSNDQGVALLPTTSIEPSNQLESLLADVQTTISREINKHNLGHAVVLCQYDASDLEPKIVRWQGKPSSTATNGWSQVAAIKKAPAMAAPQVKPVGQRPIYTVLGSKLAEAKRKKEENEELLRKKAMNAKVVDDWENEADQEDTGAEVEKKEEEAS